MADAETYDCFLSYNSQARPAARALAAGLRDRGVTVWLDQEQLRPGLPWQPLLEHGIRASRSVAVLVGADGIGPWEHEQMHAALTLAVHDQRPVIPVLLSDATVIPELPLWLSGRTWVDLRSGADAGAPLGLDSLIWGITGRRAEHTPPASALENNQAARPASVDEAALRVSELRRTLYLTGSLDGLKRLQNRVTGLAAEFPTHPAVLDLADDVKQAIVAERLHSLAPSPVLATRTHAQGTPIWLLAGALCIALVTLGVWIRSDRVFWPGGEPKLPAPSFPASDPQDISGFRDQIFQALHDRNPAAALEALRHIPKGVERTEECIHIRDWALKFGTPADRSAVNASCWSAQ